MNKYSVLIVDDELLIQELIKDYLEESFECSVVFSSNGLEGLQQGQNMKFDLIIVDYSMPIMNGVLMIKSLREQKNLNIQTPIILCTGFVDEVIPLLKNIENIYILDKTKFQTDIESIVKSIFINK
ncbi:MAG: response regulator [Oligoflexia bacterium]|nr:response regulator [Oligoflexia bacterium]